MEQSQWPQKIIPILIPTVGKRFLPYKTQDKYGMDFSRPGSINVQGRGQAGVFMVIEKSTNIQMWLSAMIFIYSMEHLIR